MPHTFYSFRRCPYAMRARLALSISGQQVNLREIKLQNKPPAMLAISKKGTVPLLQLNDGTILDESLDIMVWALQQSDPQEWLNGNISQMLSLIDKNDNDFKYWLDRYKYADRFTEYPAGYYREQAEEFLFDLECRLSQHNYLFADHISLADAAIFPFIRQFSRVDLNWFNNSQYQHLQRWLENLINQQLYRSIMSHYPTWLESEQEFIFPEKN
ncbi:glutathione S-transferase [Psychromonas sp. MME2]|uniref:glutathione S-transferase n=1 Tax=unclassified Psychromonas TaxID=2614957 RepID=UPI00339CF89C